MPSLARSLDVPALAAVANTAGRLRSLNGWAQIQREREARAEEDIREWLKSGGAASLRDSELQDLIADYGPKHEFGKQQQEVIGKILQLVRQTLVTVEASNGQPPNRRYLRSWRVRLAALIAVLLSGGIVGAVEITQPTFTEESLAAVLSRALDDPSLVSCGRARGRDGAYDCVAGWKTPGCALSARLPSKAGPGRSVIARDSCPLAYLAELRVLKAAKADCFIAYKAKVTPPPVPGLKPEWSRAPPDASPDSITGCIP